MEITKDMSKETKTRKGGNLRNDSERPKEDRSNSVGGGLDGCKENELE